MTSRWMQAVAAPARLWFVDSRTWLRRRFSDAAWGRQAVCGVIAVAIALFIVRVLGGAWTTQFKIFFPDSFSFKNAASGTPLSHCSSTRMSVR